MPLSNEEFNILAGRIRDILGEHVGAYVVAAEVPNEDESVSTVTVWNGGINTAMGLCDRAKMRMTEAAKQHDFGVGS